MGKDKKQKKKQDKDWPAENDGTETNLSSLADRRQSVEKIGKNDNNSDSDAPTINTVINNVNGDSDEEFEIVTLEQQGKKRGKARAFKGGFDLLNIEGDDDDDGEGGGDDQEELKEELELKPDIKKSEDKSKKKSKKKERRKKKQEDDEDIDKLLEELSLEMTGGKPKEKPKTLDSDVQETKNAEKTSDKVTKKKKKKVQEEEDLLHEDLLEEDDKTNESIDYKEAHTVKSAAQKKKEKKEREKAERKKSKQSVKIETETESSKADSPGEIEDRAASEESKKLENTDDENTTIIEASSKIDEDIEMNEEMKEGESTGTKKKKKKKGTADEDSKKDKKRPGKKMIAAMQEALRKAKEEEERLRLEEEAQIAAAEEAERRRQEQLQLEHERKEKKKQREKEKRERLKAEGKLLSKAQRQNRARMEATLNVLREQGLEVPKLGEKWEKPRDYKEKSRKASNKKKNIASKVDVTPQVQPEVEVQKDTDQPLNDIEPAHHSEEEDKVKESWYDTSDEDEPAKSESDTKVTSQNVSKDKKRVTEKGDSTDSEDESSEEESESTSSSGSEDEAAESSSIEAVKERIRRRREVAESKRSLSKLRSPVVCVLGHVDTGKTKILDKIRNTSVQLGESGGITQQIGATMVPADAIKEQCKFVKNFSEMELQVPGLLIIDTPGHESFSNLRSRGSSLCDIAILVVDINHGLEQQTIESINLLKQKKTPFVIALNKIDRLYEWKSTKNKDVHDLIKNQLKSTKQLFDDRVKHIVLEFANQSLNTVLYYDNKDPRTYISMVPTSALAGDGMGNLMALVAELTQKMMAQRLQFSEDLQATVLEVKAIGGLGHTMDVILVNGRLREGDTIVYAGFDGPMTTQIRSLLMPQPLKELRVKTQFIEHKEIEGAQGIKIAGKDLEKAIAGLPLLVPCRADEIPVLKEEIGAVFKETMNAIKTVSVGVYVQASTLGSLEALMEFLSTSKIPVCGVRIGPVSKRDVMKCSVMLEHGPMYAVILAFDVKIEKEAQELADTTNIKIFNADIIYHLFDMYTNFATELKEKAKDQHKNEAVFPCKLRILPQFVFNSRDPIICGVSIEAGCVKEGTPLCVPSKECLDIGIVTTIESNHKALPSARKGQEVCIKIENLGGDAPKMFGRHFDHTDVLVSKISRHSIDMCKKYFRDDLQKSDWQLMLELKSTFAIL